MSAPRNVLIIDDDLGMCESLADVLRLKGYGVEAAGSGGEALEKLGARPFDAAVVDIKLPDISGLELLEAIRTASPVTEVIFITGYASLATAIQAINGAAFAYLVKPFEMDHLLATLAKALEKQRLTRALGESEERYRLITESVNDAIFLLDLEGHLVFANRRAAEIVGSQLEELLGRQVIPLLLTQESAQQALAHLEAVRSGREVPGIEESQIVRKDGSRLWVEVNFTDVLKDGRVVGRLGVVRDITERKRLQEQVIQSEKLATMGTLLAGVAHELNNPLSSVVGHAQLLRMQEQDPKKITRTERIVEAAQRATRIVRNFLTLVRRYPGEKTTVSVNELIAKNLELLAYQLRVNDITLDTALAPGLPVFAGDPHQLQQVFLNLAHNAIQAMAARGGPGRLRIATALAPDRSAVRITVADDGPGIPPEHLPRLFEAFFTTKPPGQGTGLGLTIAKGIVAEHGGTITVESAPGQGATFVVTLPVTEPPAAAPAPAPAPRIPSGLRVLVVDDEATLRELAIEVLLEQGARAEAATSGREALEILARAPVDVIVLDIRMPEMGGMEFWSQLSRTNPVLARRTVFCTGDVVTAAVCAFLEESGCPVLNKPFELGQLVHAVASAATR